MIDSRVDQHSLKNAPLPPSLSALWSRTQPSPTLDCHVTQRHREMRNKGLETNEQQEERKTGDGRRMTDHCLDLQAHDMGLIIYIRICVQRGATLSGRRGTTQPRDPGSAEISAEGAGGLCGWLSRGEATDEGRRIRSTRIGNIGRRRDRSRGARVTTQRHRQEGAWRGGIREAAG